MNSFDLMAIAAHPDDTEFAIGGTVARMAAEGKKIIYVIATNGNKGSSDPEMTPEHLAEIREKEERAAAEVLGVKQVVFLRHEDQGLEETAELRKEIVSIVRQYKPEIVATSDPYQRYAVQHRDHRIIGRVVLDAIFPGARDRMAYPDLLDQGLLPHKVKRVMLWGPDEINYISDITATFDQKMKALRCHISQVGHMVDLEARMRKRNEGFAKGQPFKIGETFHCIDMPG
jgi:LmbE family N-acetylglucosaminyl deacetylase